MTNPAIEAFKQAVIESDGTKTASSYDPTALHMCSTFIVEASQHPILLKAAEALIESCSVTGESPAVVYYNSEAPANIKSGSLPDYMSLIPIATADLCKAASDASIGDWNSAVKTAGVASGLWEGSKFIPIIGNVTSGLSAVADVAKGNWGSAAMNAIGVIPGIGNLARGAKAGLTGLKAIKATKGLGAAAKAAPGAVKALPNAAKITKGRVGASAAGGMALDRMGGATPAVQPFKPIQPAF